MTIPPPRDSSESKNASDTNSTGCVLVTSGSMWTTVSSKDLLGRICNLKPCVITSYYNWPIIHNRRKGEWRTVLGKQNCNSLLSCSFIFSAEALIFFSLRKLIIPRKKYCGNWCLILEYSLPTQTGPTNHYTVICLSLSKMPSSWCH